MGTRGCSSLWLAVKCHGVKDTKNGDTYVSGKGDLGLSWGDVFGKE